MHFSSEYAKNLDQQDQKKYEEKKIKDCSLQHDPYNLPNGLFEDFDAVN